MGIAKYSLETRMAVVKHYLSGNKGAEFTAKCFGLDKTSVRRWVRAYELHGIDGITWKNDRHTPEFRITVVQAVLNEKISMREGAARFNISDEAVVRHWVKVFKNSGLEGLQKLKHGRPKQMIKKQSVPPPAADTDKRLETLSPEELRAELRYLHAENAYLKKLKALVQQKKKEINQE
jgi:transposase